MASAKPWGEWAANELGDAWEPDIRNVALDIEDVVATPRGTKILNAFLSSSAELFRTKRGRLALLVRIEIYNKLKVQLKLVTTEGYDGTLLVS